MKIAIVILNWNGKQLLEQFLPSVLKYSIEADIYIADNASTDDSLMFVKNNFPEIKIIRNSDNGGYAKGYNDALKLIKADIFCLLNNDVEVSENWLKPILNEFKNSDTAIIQPKILDFKNKSHFEYAGSAGGFIDKYGFPYCRGRIFNTIEKDTGQYNNNTEIFWASGACLFVKRNIFEKLQGFDEDFFAHMEEIDFCWRAKNLGYSIKYINNSIVYHLGGATLNALNPKKTYLNFRNSLYTITKNAKGNIFTLILVRLILDGIAAIKFLVEFKPLHTFSILKAHISFYKHCSTLLKKRKSQKNKILYYHKKSIVFAYFIAKTKHFNRL